MCASFDPNQSPMKSLEARVSQYREHLANNPSLQQLGRGADGSRKVSLREHKILMESEALQRQVIDDLGQLQQLLDAGLLDQKDLSVYRFELIQLREDEKAPNLDQKFKEVLAVIETKQRNMATGMYNSIKEADFKAFPQKELEAIQEKLKENIPFLPLDDQQEAVEYCAKIEKELQNRTQTGFFQQIEHQINDPNTSFEELHEVKEKLQQFKMQFGQGYDPLIMINVGKASDLLDAAYDRSFKEMRTAIQSPNLTYEACMQLNDEVTACILHYGSKFSDHAASEKMEILTLMQKNLLQKLNPDFVDISRIAESSSSQSQASASYQGLGPESLESKHITLSPDVLGDLSRKMSTLSVRKEEVIAKIEGFSQQREAIENHIGSISEQKQRLESLHDPDLSGTSALLDHELIGLKEQLVKLIQEQDQQEQIDQDLDGQLSKLQERYFKVAENLPVGLPLLHGSHHIRDEFMRDYVQNRLSEPASHMQDQDLQTFTLPNGVKAILTLEAHRDAHRLFVLVNGEMIPRENEADLALVNLFDALKSKGAEADINSMLRFLVQTITADQFTMMLLSGHPDFGPDAEEQVAKGANPYYNIIVQKGQIVGIEARVRYNCGDKDDPEKIAKSFCGVTQIIFEKNDDGSINYRAGDAAVSMYQIPVETDFQEYYYLADAKKLDHYKTILEMNPFAEELEEARNFSREFQEKYGKFDNDAIRASVKLASQIEAGSI